MTGDLSKVVSIKLFNIFEKYSLKELKDKIYWLSNDEKDSFNQEWFNSAKSTQSKLGLPKRSTEFSAAYDLSIVTPITIEPHTAETALFGVSYDLNMLDFDYVNIYALVAPRSSLAKKKGLVFQTKWRVIDYNNPLIAVNLYNYTEQTIKLESGERVAQLMFTDNFMKLDIDDKTLTPKTCIPLNYRFQPVKTKVNQIGSVENLANLVGKTEKLFPIQAPSLMVGDYYELFPGTVSMISTGLKCKLEPDEVLLIQNCVKNPCVMLANGVGIVDADYYENPDNDGEIGILLLNTGNAPIRIPYGEVIATAFITNYIPVLGDLHGGKRNGGFGSTGTN